jgi:transposase
MAAQSSNDNAMPFSSSAARDWREGRRLRALELIAEGYRSSEVARVLGVTAGAVSQWLKRAKVGGGAAALLRRKPRGRGARLSAEQLRELTLLLEQTQASGEWTSRRVAVLISEKWGIGYSRAQVSRILKKIGFVSVARHVDFAAKRRATVMSVSPGSGSAEQRRL